MLSQQKIFQTPEEFNISIIFFSFSSCLDSTIDQSKGQRYPKVFGRYLRVGENYDCSHGVVTDQMFHEKLINILN